MRVCVCVCVCVRVWIESLRSPFFLIMAILVYLFEHEETKKNGE